MPELEIFLCSADEDADLRNRLEQQLNPYCQYGLIKGSIWSSKKIDPGMEKDFEIQKHLHASQVILLLVSPDFIEKCVPLVQQAMERHTRDEALVVPVLLRPAPSEYTPFGKLQVAPKDKIPITSGDNEQDEAFLKVAEEIYEAIKNKYGTLRATKETASHLPTTVPDASKALTTETAKKFAFTHVHTAVDHLGPVASVAFSQNGELLVSDSWDNTIKIRDRDAKQVHSIFKGHVGAVYSVVFSTDGSKLVSGGDDTTIKIWDVKGVKLSQTLKCHTRAVSSVVSDLNKSIVISGSDDSTIIMWDVDTGKPLHILTGHTGPVSGIFLSADRQRLVSSSHDGTIKMWNMHTGQMLESFPARPNCPIYSIASSPDMSILISGDQDGTMTVWDMHSMTPIPKYTLAAHTEEISSIALSPDRQTLVSGSYDKTIKVWSLTTGQMLRELTGHTKAVLSVAWHPDGNTIASGSLDKTVKIWQLPQTPIGAAPSQTETKMGPPPVPEPKVEPLQPPRRKQFDPNFYKSSKNRVFLYGGIIVDLCIALLLFFWLQNTNDTIWSQNAGNVLLLSPIILVAVRGCCASAIRKNTARPLAWILALSWGLAGWALTNIVPGAKNLSALILVFILLGWVSQDLLYASKKAGFTK